MAKMVRQLVKSGDILRFLRVQPQLMPASSILTARYYGNEPPAKSDTVEVKSKMDLAAQKPKKFKIDKEMYDDLVRSNKVVVFMKGTPQSPRCGFSNAVVQIFRMHGVKYDAHDVLSDDELREGIKSYTDWPTIPQVFIDGEFVGGCDILLEMHQNGDLVENLKKAGIESELLRLQNELEKTNQKKKD